MENLLPYLHTLDLIINHPYEKSMMIMEEKGGDS